MKNAIRFGIMSLEDYRERTMQIARGEYRPGPDEPKIWFESVAAMERFFRSEGFESLENTEELPERKGQ